jgi:hypothetical protein
MEQETIRSLKLIKFNHIRSIKDIMGILKKFTMTKNRTLQSLSALYNSIDKITRKFTTCTGCVSASFYSNVI